MRLRALAIVGLALACACNALTGASDLEIGEELPTLTDGGSGEETGVSPPRDGSLADSLAPLPDGSLPDAAGRPSYCLGISLYLRFDNTTKSAQGDSPAVAVAETYGTGKFKGAFDFNAQKTVVFAAVKDGTKRYDIEVGTLSLWFKPRWSFATNTATRTFMRPQDQSNATTGGAPNLRLDSVAKTLGVEGPANVEATAQTTALQSTWKELDWNHLVGSWQRAGALETLAFTLNGGGLAGSPGRISSKDTWTPAAPALAGAFIRLNSTSDIDGLVDDVTVWSRVLPKEEVTALYADGNAGKSVGDTCGLP